MDALRMPQTFARKPIVSDSPHAATNVEGPPQQRSFRGVLRDQYEQEGDALTACLFEDIDSTGLSDDEVGERTGIDKAQLSRIRQGKAHAPGRLIAWAIDQSRIVPPRYVVAICRTAEGEFKPKPPPSDAEWFAAKDQVLREMGIDGVVIERARGLLGRGK